MKQRKPMVSEPSVFYRRKKGKLKLELPSELKASPVKMDMERRDRGGGKRGRR